jgi:hypothetical protein
MKTKGTFILSEDYEKTGKDDGIWTTSVIVDIDYLRKTFTIKPDSFENDPEFKFKDSNECFAVASLFMSAMSLVEREFAS